MLQGVSFHPVGASGACSLDGHSSSRCRRAVPLVVTDAALGAPIQGQSGPRLSLGAVRAKASVITDAVRDGCRCGEAAPGSLGLWWVEMGHGMCLRGLGLESKAL